MTYIIWCAVSLLFAVIGICTRFSKKAAGVWTFTKAPDIPEENIKSYNSDISLLWFLFSAALLVLGLPLIKAGTNSVAILPSILGLLPLVIFLMYKFAAIERKYKKK